MVTSGNATSVGRSDWYSRVFSSLPPRARARRACGAVWLAVALAISGSAFAGDLDTVFLKDGGRIRGTVMVEDPKDGVQIKLPDQAVFAIDAHANPPAAISGGAHA